MSSAENTERLRSSSRLDQPRQAVICRTRPFGPQPDALISPPLRERGFQATGGILHAERPFHKYPTIRPSQPCGRGDAAHGLIFPFAGVEYDEDEFRPKFNLLNPIDLGKMGKGGWYGLASARAAWRFRPPTPIIPRTNPPCAHRPVAQTFIDTGVPGAEAGRVLTLLGEPPLIAFANPSGVNAPPAGCAGPKP